ncbi:MAG TPA: 2-oxopent-4-enoate hydratase [Thermopetrobacter sp.]|nr:2-oxopent-4-enoate hydratase [Thermopetrobacter sp.]
MDAKRRQTLAEELYRALRDAAPVDPISERHPEMGIDDAYDISGRFLQLRMDNDGERVIGRKIGITAKAVQRMLDVDQPDYGWLTDAMWVPHGAAITIAGTMIAPRVEGEIAFVLADDLAGPGVSEADVLAATDFVAPCFEIVDSRIRDWKIRITDTIADNASCGMFMIGPRAVSPFDLDLSTCGMVFELNGEITATGAGAAALGASPLTTVAWLANAFGARGESLKAGEVILSGSLVPLQPVKVGDVARIHVGGLGDLSIRFA